jgi:hypothetical protein
MTNYALLKEGKWTYACINPISAQSKYHPPFVTELTLRPINNLIRNHKVPWPDLLLQAAHSTESYHSSDPNAS